MKCPYCNSNNSRVVDTREVPDGIRRRRECGDCQQRYTTYERVAGISLLIVKQDGRRESFDREKLVKSMLIACTKRPIPMERIEQAARDIETDLYAQGKGEIKSKDVGRRVMDQLRQVDEVAYVRYASVYRHFEDISSMADEIQNLIERKKREEREKNQIPLPIEGQ